MASSGPDPAAQMREMLACSREAGVAFDSAWEAAFARIRWPHDTGHRIEWKLVIDGQRRQWSEAYDREPAPSKVAIMAWFADA